MIIINGSMEWVYHDRGATEPSLVRRYQEECWKRLFSGRTLSDIVYELNTRWFPDGKQVILLNPRDPVEMVQHVRDLLTEGDYDIALTVKNVDASSRMQVFAHH